MPDTAAHAGRAGTRLARLGFRPTLTRIIAVTTVLAVLILGTIFALAAWRDRAQALREAETVAQNLATVLAEHASRLLGSAHFVMREAVRLAGPPGGPIPADRATHEALRRLTELAPQVAAIWIGDADGNAVVTSRAFPAPRLNAADRPYFQAVRDDQESFYIGLLPDNRFTDATLIMSSRRIEPVDGPFRGFVQVSISPEYIRSLYASLTTEHDTELWLLDGGLRPLLREPAMPVQELLAARTEELFAAARYLDHGSFITMLPTAQGGVERLFVAEKVPGYGAHVVVGIARDEALARWRGRLWVYLVAAGAACVAVLGLGLVATRQAQRELAFTRLLDRRVRERTAELETAMERLEQALAAKSVLLREVNHRVKNSLQLVSSLLALQAKQAPNWELADSLGEAQRRVATVARVHEQLYRTDKVEAVELGAYLRELCTELESSLAENDEQRRLLVEAAEAELPTDKVAPLALAVNELVTNAWKHAYPAGGGGTITVSLTRQDGFLELAVADQGAGLPEGFTPGTASGLGMRLVQALVRQIGGTLRIERGPPGTRFVIEVPP